MPGAIRRSRFLPAPTGGGGGGGQLGAGIRAGSTTVGYLGSDGDLTVYNPGGTPPAGWAWDGNTLVTTTANATLDHARVNGSVVAGHSNPTVTDCKIVVSAGEIFGVSINGSGKGVLTIRDTTVIGSLGGVNPQVNGISSDSSLAAYRCHITQTGDGIHFVGDNSTIISQCYIGPLRFTDEAQHCDAMQHFQAATTQTFTVEHCYIAHTSSTIGTPMNAALTMGPPSATGATWGATITNNYFGGGLYHLRFNFQGRSLVVTNNDFGPIHASEFGYHDFDTGNGSTYTTWSNNRDENSTLIPAP